jgi:hypothetical protein
MFATTIYGMEKIMYVQCRLVRMRLVGNTLDHALSLIRLLGRVDDVRLAINLHGWPSVCTVWCGPMPCVGLECAASRFQAVACLLPISRVCQTKGSEFLHTTPDPFCLCYSSDTWQSLRPDGGLLLDVICLCAHLFRRFQQSLHTTEHVISR